VKVNIFDGSITAQWAKIGKKGGQSSHVHAIRR